MTISKPPFKETHNIKGKLTHAWVRFYLDLWERDREEQATVLITSSDSPYALLSNIGVLMCDTDSGAMTVNMYVGGDGDAVSIYNVGSSGNDVTLVAGTGDTIRGESTQTLFDGENWDARYQTTEKWR